MVVTWGDVKDHFKVGDIVYACAYTPTYNKEGRHNYQKPIRGMLVLDNSEERCEKRAKAGYDEPRYFVPFKKNGKDLAWSKAVTVYSRYFTDDENESKEYYNKLVREQLHWHQAEIEKLKEEFV